MLLHEPSTFTDYILGSPSLWWDRGVVFELEQDQATSWDDLDAKVFLGIGAHETNEGRQREAVNMGPEERAITAAVDIDMVADTRRLADALRARRLPSLAVEHAVFDEEFHVTVAALNLSRGLRWVFDAPT